ncbi:DUF1479-domain-containing protein [Sistotremastrum suecicum HHB10207 ss-3]|uniref:DUF1479-domain-containing protein n=1 Tax=Sistotremastrum suecicum HHB10207 ss-3 TaxID=1314776 RepID=A0A165YGZ7_9AGAM|nr:DUF1479-domain-containing protein [Sistotremastrum suecicum HHB10207 ss-3]
MMEGFSSVLPERFLALKKELVNNGEAQERLTQAWNEILANLETMTKEAIETGPEIIPQIDFSEIDSLSSEKLADIKRRGGVVIRNVVDDAEALRWTDSLREYVKVNPVDGLPLDNKQFFMLYWTQSQVRARSHPNVLKVSTWLNTLYGAPDGNIPEGVHLDQPLSYADRFRIRHAGGRWNDHKPHIDGGSIERWEDDEFRNCFAEILQGDWRKHNPYNITNRLNAKSSLYGRPNQSSVFRTFQGWLALSETGPGEGTLKLFPDVLLSNAYLILRPFFRPVEQPVSSDPLDPQNWKFDISTTEFPGIYTGEGGGFYGPRLSSATHPHMRIDEVMTSIPKVWPGDMVFWHCDVVHSVEPEHVGKNDSAAIYIPAVPSTPANREYLERQRQAFLRGVPPPDFPQVKDESEGEKPHQGNGVVSDISGDGRRAMGFEVSVGA